MSRGPYSEAVAPTSTNMVVTFANENLPRVTNDVGWFGVVVSLMISWPLKVLFQTTLGLFESVPDKLVTVHEEFSDRTVITSQLTMGQ